MRWLILLLLLPPAILAGCSNLTTEDPFDTSKGSVLLVKPEDDATYYLEDYPYVPTTIRWKTNVPEDEGNVFDVSWKPSGGSWRYVGRFSANLYNGGSCPWDEPEVQGYYAVKIEYIDGGSDDRSDFRVFLRPPPTDP